MKFYLKTWFIAIMFGATVLLFISIIFLSDISGNFGATVPESVTKNTGNAPVEKQSAFLDGAPTRGDKNAPVQVVEFADFQCPFCREAVGVLTGVFAKFPDAIYLQYRHFPIEREHPFALVAAEASMCANEQGKFWEYHDILFQNQGDLSPSALNGYARNIGLDINLFAQCVKDRVMAPLVQKDFNDGLALEVKATPTFFINGRKIEGVLPEKMWEQLIMELK
jgi:protein-disulfide isomerase